MFRENRVLNHNPGISGRTRAPSQVKGESRTYHGWYQRDVPDRTHAGCRTLILRAEAAIRRPRSRTRRDGERMTRVLPKWSKRPHVGEAEGERRRVYRVVRIPMHGIVGAERVPLVEGVEHRAAVDCDVSRAQNIYGR